jgi:glutamate dehydrogenase
MSTNSCNSKSLSLSKLNCKINDFGPEILELVNAESKGSLYTKFVRRFLTYIPVDYRSKEKIRLFGDFTSEAFDFFIKKPRGESKIEIIESKFNNNPAITLLIAIENRPFIIDSLNCLISRLALQAIFTFHPVINSIRDNEGNLLDITEKKNDGINEALVYIKILGSFDEDTIDRFKEEIHKVIDLVDYTYSSWQPLLNKIITITTDIVHNKDLYENNSLAVEETLDFLHWLQQNNITFLGAADFDLNTGKITHEEGVSEIWENNISEISEIIKFSNSKHYQNKLIMLGKINKLSPVHRSALVDYILVKHLDEDGVYRRGAVIFGLYGTAIYFQSINSVPILRDKMNYALEESGFPISGYNAKKIKNIIESLPRDILIQIDEEDLHCMCVHMLSSMRSHRLKLFIQQDWSSSFINIIIFLPRERLTPEAYKEISNYLADKFGSEVISDNITVVAQNFSHLFATIAIQDPKKLEFSESEIEKDLVRITTNWSDALLLKLCETLGEYEGGLKHKKIISSFPADYKHKFDIDSTIDDITHLEEATKHNKSVSNLLKGEGNEYYLKFYSPEISLRLSDILPSLENLGFIAIDGQSFTIKESSDFKKSWIYEFKLFSPIPILIPYERFKSNVEEALEKTGTGELVSDSLSKLIALAGFDWLKVKFLRAITRYLHQTEFLYGKGYVQQTLIKHYEYTGMLTELFEARFCPDNSSLVKAELLSEKLNTYLDKVESSTEDKVLKNMYSIIMAIVRTNFYQLNSEGKIKDYISFKFDSSKIPSLPKPVPYAEIFVYSNEFEGVHLRRGKVARGGLRWSDRGEDYRTEVLGLLKAQMAKNTIIVPVGSKGTFYVNISQGEMDRDSYMQHVIACYKNFLRGLLDLTDNLVEGEIVQPANTVIYDDKNPYLVVAADKGTATFSDFANAISQEYDFWLGDAFASGGSVGYDHKKMAITAKGAWLSAQLHFLDKGINIQHEPFTVVGIGDMSGDVFGNGMLLSKYIKLVAAFNHQHIFIDPDPDCKISYQERQRLFNLQRSKWSDYNIELISKGGGIFDRCAKKLTISPEIKKLLNIDPDQITPDELIKKILKFDVDLIWNGGIGTYIKASSENHLDIGDKVNDTMRINGNEVKAKVISEGGNVGISQLGRVEYALNGGVINTDFIDNSAGVDCSDHEVNIKIALNLAVTKGKITLEERNNLLVRMTSQVETLVLKDNYDQHLAITTSTLSKSVNVESFSQLIQELEKKNLLDREVEFLPEKAELSRRTIAKQGMTRPELAILLSYSKISLDAELSEDDLTLDEHFKSHLFTYFPETMRKKFREEIENHPLKQEIIRMIITNKLINQLGGPVLSQIKHETGGRADDIAKAYEIVTEIFDLHTLWKKIKHLDIRVSTNTKVEMFTDLNKIMRRGISWFVKNIKPPINISKNIKEFSQQIDDLMKIISDLLVGTIQARFFNKIEHYTGCGVDKKLAKSVATLEVLVSAFDIVYTAKNTGAENKKVANLYFAVGDLLSIDWLRDSCEAQINESYWNRLSIQSLKDDLYDKQRRLVDIIISTNPENDNITSWLECNAAHCRAYINFIDEIKSQEVVNLNMLILANKKLEIFLRKTKVN